MLYLLRNSTLFFSLLLAMSCVTSQPANQNRNTSKKLPATKFYVDLSQDGNFVETILDTNPQPYQGKDQWTRDFYGAISYPPSARHNSISGIVVLDVLLNEFGQVQEVGIRKSLSANCDKAAVSAFQKSTTQGYSAALVDGMAVKCRMDIPVGFWLN